MAHTKNKKDGKKKVGFMRQVKARISIPIQSDNGVDEVDVIAHIYGCQEVEYSGGPTVGKPQYRFYFEKMGKMVEPTPDQLNFQLAQSGDLRYLFSQLQDTMEKFSMSRFTKMNIKELSENYESDQFLDN